MRRIIEEIKVYQFDELPEKTQDEIIQNWNSEGDYAHNDEYQDSLTEFCRVLSIRLNNWSYGPYSQGFINWSYDNLENGLYYDNDLQGFRLRTWLINNFLPELRKGKFYSKQTGYNKTYSYVSRHSKINFEYDCNLTGVCTDLSLTQPIIKFIDTLRDDLENDQNLEDIINSCFNNFLSDYQANIEGQDSKAYIKDSIEANEYEFLENGTIYNG